MPRYLFLSLAWTALVRGYIDAQQTFNLHDEASVTSLNAPFNDELDQFISKILERHNIPGLSIAIVDGSQVHAKGYGFAELPSTKATPNTLYWAGSTTKSFTAAAILKLIEDFDNSSSLLKLSTPVSNVIDFVVEDGYTSHHATFEDLLSHRTGLPRHDQSYGGPGANLTTLLKEIRHLPMTAELRARWQYCNIMFGVLSLAIETMTGDWIGDVFRKWFWEPLDMHQTFLSVKDALKSTESSDSTTFLATGYAWDEATRSYVPYEYLDDPIVSGAGAVISTVLDYSRYLRAMIVKDARILSATSYDELRTPRIINEAKYGLATLFPLQAYGLAWQIGSYHDHKIYYHSGLVPGFSAFMAYIPDVEIGIVMLSNNDDESTIAENVIAAEWLQSTFGVSRHERVDVGAKLAQLAHETHRNISNAASNLYPDVPKDPQKRPPATLPLDSYAGRYHNAGYGTLEFELANTSAIYNAHNHIKAKQVLHADVDKTWKQQLDLEHVAADLFVAWQHTLDAETWSFVDAMRAEFRIGSSGEIVALGLGYEKAMGLEKIWYDRME